MTKKVGAQYLGNKITRFTVWAPLKEKVEVVFKKDRKSEVLTKDSHGYWEKEIENVKPDTLYKFKLDGKDEFPDPASLSQPDGVHSWSKVIDQNNFQWSDNNWKGLRMEEMIIYELHVGTFTEEGSFEAVLTKLDHLLELGINTIEILPISQFPGDRNWGYDGVYPFAAQDSYGGVEGLKTMVTGCHEKGIAVILDVVYNHMGPEGNYLSQYGPYFTEKYHTPWGAALNFDDKHSDEVRNFFLENGIMWLRDFRIDGLRLDAIHEIIDRSSKHLLRELSERTDELEEETGRQYVLIAESDLNDTKIINPYKKGGHGLEGQWVDDFHHSLHTLLTGEKNGYYTDFGFIEHLAKAYRQAFVYDGVYSGFRKRTVGNNPKELPASSFVVCIQNHDQIGNRMLGERLPDLLSLEELKLAAGVVISSAFVPMLFMGEEFAEDQPFQYFVSHGDPDLVKAVQDGRKREFKYFYNDSQGEFPDPQSEETYEKSKLNWNFRKDEKKETVFAFYKELINLRKEGAFEPFRRNEISTDADEEKKVLIVSTEGKEKLIAVFNFNKEEQEVSLPKGSGSLEKVISSAEEKWGGSKDFPEKIDSEGSITIPATSFLIIKK